MRSPEENRKVIALLGEYLKKGYLLHGGKKKLAIIEPRQATDDDPKRTTGKALALYAEKNDVRIPIFMALFAKKNPLLRGWTSEYSSHEPGGTMTIRGDNYTFTKGFIHVLPPNTFLTEGDEHDKEYISRVPVTPIEIIPIDPSVLSELENIIIEK